MEIPGESQEIEFHSREYQEQLAEVAIQKNVIIFLPTGSGKTFIATLVIEHFCKLNDNVNKKLEDGGKRAIFLVNTVALVQQQVKQIRQRYPYTVNGFSGDIGVDFWNSDIWKEQINTSHVLVMTTQIFVDLLNQSFMKLNNVSVIVFDECHHAVNDHPMRQVMKNFGNVPQRNHPRVVGLTATLLNKNLKVDKVETEIRTLEMTFLSQIATADNEELVKLYSTNPTELKVIFTDNDLNQKCYYVRNRFFEKCLQYIQNFEIDSEEKPDHTIRPPGAKQIESKHDKTNKDLKNVLTDIQVNMDDLGVYGGHIALLARLLQMQKMILNCQSEITKTVFEVFNTDLVLLRKFFEIEMKKRASSELEQIRFFSSNKVLKLFGVLKKLNKDDHALVFVKRRFTAKILNKVVSNAAQVDPNLKHIKSDFIVGYNVTNPFKDTRENILQRNYNDKVLEKFNSGMLNVLFGSNVVEEGMDVSKCNMVIMFDAPLDFRAYTQSKGRARHLTSQYIIMTSDPNYNVKYIKFREVEAKLRELLCAGRYLKRIAPTKEELDATLFANIPGLESYKPFGDNGPTITALSAVTHINRYFATLKVDRFTRITPYWFIENQGTTKYKCYLHLPMESTIRGRIEGTWQNNQENAKRSVALEACKHLHRCGELDDEHLLPITVEAKIDDNCDFMPNKDINEVFTTTDPDGRVIPIGTKNNKRRWPKKWPDCLTSCSPVAGKEVYLHVLDLKPVYHPPADHHRLQAMYHTLCEPVSFAIVSSKLLPKLASFPLYMSTGELEANISKTIPIVLDKSQLQKVSKFHGLLFEKVDEVVKEFLIRDFSNRQNSYLIAPVVLGDAGVTISWETVEAMNKPFPKLDCRPSEEERRSLVVDDDHYLGMIVSPWYRTVPPQKFLVTKVCYDMSEDSPFPSDNYNTYKDYFVDKYNIVPMIQQPLLEVRTLSSRMNNTKPLSLTKDLRRKNKDENEEFEVWLVPEFCHVYPLPGRYWLKARLLPSTLHRITQLCAAEELRVAITRQTGIGIEQLSPGENWKKLEEDPSLIKQSAVEKTQSITPLSSLFRNNFSLQKSPVQLWETEDMPIDIERNMDNVTLFDVLFYNKFVDKPLSIATDGESTEMSENDSSKAEAGDPMDMDLNPDISVTEDPSAGPSCSTGNATVTAVIAGPSTAQVSGSTKQTGKRKLPKEWAKEHPLKKRGQRFLNVQEIEVPKMVDPPPLKMLQRDVFGLGPQQVQILQAVTAKVSLDFINCERLETLGDSFLKFAISLTLFERQGDWLEGFLTSLKGQIVGNKNLYFCGKKNKLGSMLEVQVFSPKEEWVPPQFSVEHSIQGVITEALLDPSVLYSISIPAKEREAGRIGKATYQAVSDILLLGEDVKQVQCCPYINQLALTDKNIADAVEALLGVYLENSGLFGALKIMNWFGVIDPSLSTPEVFTDKPASPVKGTRGSPSDHLIQPFLLEKILNYKFRNQAYILQAVTHPSYTRNNLTQSYQRLEFLGDALIDFLITVHIYERCKELDPGDLTDLRSALVNNITLGCITVRHKLHKFLLHRSNKLHDCMMRFVKHQEERNHLIDNDILFLCEEGDVNIAEAVEVPKTLGDIFEALVGAVYLDSDKDLNVTWKIIYNLMKDEIEKFHSDVPKNHVRMLYESTCNPIFKSMGMQNGVVMVSVEVDHRGTVICCDGFGDTKRQAKRAAAKLALRKIRAALV